MENVTLKADLHLTVIRSVELHGDLNRKVGNRVSVKEDTLRDCRFHETLKLDTCRKLSGPVTVKASTCIYTTTEVHIGDDGAYISSLAGRGRIVSINLSQTINDMSDTLTVVAINADFDVRDKISGSILDYDLTGFEVSEVTKEGQRTTIRATQSARKFGKGILYYGDASKEKVFQKVKSNTDSSGFRVVKVESSRGAWHELILHPVTEGDPWSNDFEGAKVKIQLAAMLKNLGVTYTGTDYGLTTEISNQSTTVANLISAVISWAKSVPDRMIIAHIRGDKIVCMQRGYEGKTTDISSLRHPAETVNIVEDQNYVCGERVTGWKTAIEPKVTSKSEFKWIDLPLRNNKPFGSSTTTYNFKNSMAGRPLHSEKKNDDGSGESVDYIYDDGSDVNRVIEKHTKWDTEKNKETWTITHESVADSPLVSQAFRESDDEPPESSLGTSRLSSLFNTSVFDDGSDTIKWWFDAKQGYKLYDIERMDNQGNTIYYESYTGQEALPFPLTADNAFSLIKHLADCKKVTTITITLVSPVSAGKPDYKHIITHYERIKYNDALYFLESNNLSITTKEFKQTLVLKKYDAIGG